MTYRYPAFEALSLDLEVINVHAVVDGDTYWLVVVPDLEWTAKHRYRPVGVDTAEVREVLGPAATDFSRWWLAEHAGRLRVRVWKLDGFGRHLCYVYDRVSGEDISSALRKAGHDVAGYLEVLP